MTSYYTSLFKVTSFLAFSPVITLFLPGIPESRVLYSSVWRIVWISLAIKVNWTEQSNCWWWALGFFSHIVSLYKVFCIFPLWFHNIQRKTQTFQITAYTVGLVCNEFQMEITTSPICLYLDFGLNVNYNKKYCYIWTVWLCCTLYCYGLVMCILSRCYLYW